AKKLREEEELNRIKEKNRVDLEENRNKLAAEKKKYEIETERLKEEEKAREKQREIETIADANRERESKREFKEGQMEIRSIIHFTCQISGEQLTKDKELLEKELAEKMKNIKATDE
ncbi:18348_t:CDS:2, partial [Funneliformis geosporum]